MLLFLILLLRSFFFILILFFVPSFFSFFSNFCIYLIGNRCTHKPDAKDATNPAALLSLLTPDLQTSILTTGTTLPRLRQGTLDQKEVLLLMEMMSHLGIWMDPNLALTPLQWVPSLNGEQIFDALRLFISDQTDPSPDQRSKIAFMYHLLGCHGDLHNCKKRPQILAFKMNNNEGRIVGMIGYPRLSVDSSLQSIIRTKDLHEEFKSYHENLPKHRRSLNEQTVQNASRGRDRSLIPTIVSCKSNLNPHSPFQGIIHSVLLLVDHFHLDLLQTASVLCAWDFCADCSYYFVAATIFAIGHFQPEDFAGMNIGHNLLKLIRSIYIYEDKPECKNIQKQFNRYTNNADTCFHSKSNFEHMVYLRFFLGQWCFVHHLNEPSSKASRKSTYNKLFDIFVKPAKKMAVLCGGHGLILWSLFGFFPVWVRTYRALPGNKDKNVKTIADTFNLDIDTPEAAETLLSSVAIGLSYERQVPIDRACLEHEICKFGRHLRKAGETWRTWCLPNQFLYDAYDIDVMNNKLTQNNIVVIHSNGEKIPLSRTSIFGSWLDAAKDYKSITLANMAFTTLLQKYIPASTATSDHFSTLSDILVEGKGNNILLDYISEMYPDTKDFILPPISPEVRRCITLKNYKSISKQQY